MMSIRRRSLLSLTASAICLAAGCNAILGNEEGTLRASIGDAGAIGASVGDGDRAIDGQVAADATFDAALSCPADKKACSTFGACVDPNDPNYGCGDPACNACDTSNALSVVCAGVNGQNVCKPRCKPGFKDCDGKADNGCEADLSKAATCGDCGVQCGATAPLCSKNSGGAFACVGNCPTVPTPQTKCGNECVDTTSNPDHCGGCPNECPAPPNATATCTLNVCGFSCDALHHACKGQCVKDSEVTACGPSCKDCTQAPPANTKPSCQAGACHFECLSGWADCNGDLLLDGCETNLLSGSGTCGVPSR